MASRKALGIGLAVLVLAAAGCGPPIPPLIDVEGVVLLDGLPLGKVQVNFIPEDEEGRRLPSSQGLTDENGQFKLVCENGSSGAVAGPHKVMVRRPSRRRDPDKKAEADVGPAIPLIYQSILDTPLKVVVQGDKQSCILELESQ